jgi:hypothetical protein
MALVDYIGIFLHVAILLATYVVYVCLSVIQEKKEIGTHIFFKLNFTAINSLFLVFYTAAMRFP